MTLPPKSPRLDVRDPRVAAAIARYWRRNITVMVLHLVIWAAAGLGCGVLFADRLNELRFGGFRLGFWFAQQGSLIIFVLMILSYALIMNRLDALHQQELAQIRRERDDAQ